MTRSRTPFALVLKRLTAELSAAVLAAVRGATLAEIVGLVAASAQRAPTAPLARPAAALPASSGRVRAPGARRPPRVPASGKVRVSKPPPAAEDENAPGDGTAIDAVAMLASLDRPAARLEGPAPAAPPFLAQETPATAPTRSTEAAMPAMRAGEDVLRTPTGGLVLRRRRASGNLA